MMIDMTTQVATAPLPVMRFRIDASRGYIDAENQARQESGPSSIINCIQILTFVAGLSAAVSSPITAGGSAAFEPLKKAGTVGGFFAAAFDWVDALEDVARGIEAVATTLKVTRPAGEPFYAAPVLNRLSAETDAPLSRAKDAEGRALALAAQSGRRSRRHASERPVEQDTAEPEWLRHLLSDAASQIQSARVTVARSRRTFSQGVVDAATSSDSRHPQSLSRAAINRSSKTARQCRELRMMLSKIRPVALDAGLQPYLIAEPEVFRIRYESPLELVIAVVGGAGAVVALVQQLLDLEVRIRTRKLRIDAEKLELEKKLEGHKEAREALADVRAGLTSTVPLLPPGSMEVFDSSIEERRDRSSMGPSAD